MENFEIKNSLETSRAREASRAYSERAKERRAEEEKELSYKEELKKAREEHAAEEKRQKKINEPKDSQSATVAKKSAQEMLDLLAELTSTPNISANSFTNTN